MAKNRQEGFDKGLFRGFSHRGKKGLKGHRRGTFRFLRNRLLVKGKGGLTRECRNEGHWTPNRYELRYRPFLACLRLPKEAKMVPRDTAFKGAE